MKRSFWPWSVAAILVLSLLLLCAMPAWLAASARAAATHADSAIPKFDEAFGKTWFAGDAELAAYDLVHPRYKELRHGTAVTVFCTETFSNSLRVKSDPGKHPATDEFPVMKFNLMENFSTGIYDYNLMGSVFVALAPVNGRGTGLPTKVAFSSQEWCGTVYEQLLFDEDSIRDTRHSYFDGEADANEIRDYPRDGISEDALFHWARGFAAPVLAAGESREVPLLKSLKTVRLSHEPIAWLSAHLTREVALKSITVPAGTFDAIVMTCRVDKGRTWTFHIESAPAHRIVQWSCSDGTKAQLLGSERVQYWNMNGEKFTDAVKKLGLNPRQPHTP
jgi:hypothetical protein